MPQLRAPGKATQTTRSSVSQAGALQWIYNCSVWHLASFISIKGNIYKGNTVHFTLSLAFPWLISKGRNVSSLFFHPLSFVSRCYWGSISTRLHMVKHVPKSWHNVTKQKKKPTKKKAEHAAKKVSGALKIVEHHWPPLGWDTHCRSPKLGTGTSWMGWAHGQINVCLHCKVPCLRREGGQLCFRSCTTGVDQTKPICVLYVHHE